MQGVLIRYPFGIPYALIAEMSEDVVVTTIVTGQSQENYVLGQYASHGVNVSNCDFLWAPTDSWWTRDYGPWFVVDGSNQVGIVNFKYNRPRPNDDDIPIEMADFLDVPLYGMDLEHSGGNYMTESMGISASTDLVWYENSNMTHTEIAQMVEDYLGVHTYHVVDDPNNTYIDHIDCWGKFLDIDKIMIREVPPSHSQYDEIEATVAYFAAQTSSYGTLYKIYRVYTPSDQPYTNSLILNDKVLVPITGSVWDDDAIASYESAMPGYEVLGISGSWYSTDALHCRAKGVADIGMLYIEHIPVSGTMPAGATTQVEAQIIPYSGAAVIPDSVFVYYRLNGGAYMPASMVNVHAYSWLG
jgi:agmatine/peptidylarginine deiminase